MTAVLLVNMGSPVSEADMKEFLFRMFRDKAIIGAPKLIRHILSFFIGNLRYKNSWKKYQSIGGSPLFAAMLAIKNQLAAALPNTFFVSCAYSYSNPLIAHEILRLEAKGFLNFIVLPMYPQASFSTTASIEADVAKVLKSNKKLNVKIVREYCLHETFVKFWGNAISDQLEKLNFSEPYLLFSAHAIPQAHILKGDKYTQSIEKTAMLIAKSLNLPWGVSYQSKIGPVKWAGPDTKAHLRVLNKKGVDEIVIVPVSFITENLETLYDLDAEILPYAKNVIGIKKIERVVIPACNNTLTGLFGELVEIKI